MSARKNLCDTCGYLDLQMEKLKSVENQKLWAVAFKAALSHREAFHPFSGLKPELDPRVETSGSP